MTRTILIVESDCALAESIREYLARGGWEVAVSASYAQALSALEAVRPNIVVADYRLPDKTGIDLIKAAVSMDPHIKVVLITGEGSIQVAVEAIKAGAYEYLSKPLVLAELKQLLEHALDAARAFYEQKQARGSGAEALLGESPPIRHIKDTIAQIMEMEARVIDGDLPAVLITGETGTGKELVARALHFDGRRRDRPFVEVNCASIPASLLEAELFGHERGAFTDAKERKVGLVESAEGGTLFLDEIGEVDLGIQAKLLKLLEERAVRRIGSVHERKVNVRIISATNRDLERMVHEGRFRADLFFRLRIITLHMPRLRERGSDVLLLARHFLRVQSDRYGRRGLAFGGAAERALLAYHWPGNVRELRNMVAQAVLLTPGNVILPANITPCLQLRDFVGMDPGGPSSPIGAHSRRDGRLDRATFEATLEQTDWNIAQAARLLGISRDTLRYRVKKYGLTRGSRPDQAPCAVEEP